MAFVKTKVEELPESRVRLDVEVPEEDVAHAFEHAATDMAESLRLPGFRKGKAPVPVVVARVGREAVWQEALRGHLDSWFWSAAETSGIRPVASPEVEFDGLPDDGGTFKFSATVAVMPKPEVADWTALEVPFAEAEVPAEAVDAELDRLRDTVAELAPVENRAGSGRRHGRARHLGRRRASAARLRHRGRRRPARQRDRRCAAGHGAWRDEERRHPGRGGTAPVEVTVKEIKEKVLPEADDELARSASEFETLEELRAEIESRLLEQLTEELEIRFREAAVDALVNASEVETVEPLVERRTAELWSGIARSLQMRGISTETYLTMTGQSADEVVARLRAEAEQSLARELVLDAAASKLGVEVPDEEIDELIESQSEEGDDIEESKRLLQENGGYERIRADLRLKKALDEIVAGVKRIPVELAAARDKLWTPEKEKEGTKMNIWTPGSEEAR